MLPEEFIIDESFWLTYDEEFHVVYRPFLGWIFAAKQMINEYLNLPTSIVCSSENIYSYWKVLQPVIVERISMIISINDTTVKFYYNEIELYSYMQSSTKHELLVSTNKVSSLITVLKRYRTKKNHRSCEMFILFH